MIDYIDQSPKRRQINGISFWRKNHVSRRYSELLRQYLKSIITTKGAMQFAVTSLQRRDDLVGIRNKVDFENGRMKVMQKKPGSVSLLKSTAAWKAL